MTTPSLISQRTHLKGLEDNLWDTQISGARRHALEVHDEHSRLDATLHHPVGVCVCVCGDGQQESVLLSLSFHLQCNLSLPKQELDG